MALFWLHRGNEREESGSKTADEHSVDVASLLLNSLSKGGSSL